MAKQYQQKGKFAGSQRDKLSNTLANSAIPVHSRILSLQLAREALEWAEENMLTQYPLKTISAPQAKSSTELGPGSTHQLSH